MGDGGRFGCAVAVVTGAGSGIGRASAQRFAEEGATVVVADRYRNGEETVGLIAERGGEAEPVAVDVLEPGAVDALLDGVVERHGRLDVVVHNNVGFGGRAATEEVYDETWARGIDGNLGATFRRARAALRITGPRGGGAVVNTASLAGTAKVEGNTPYYGTAKAGVIHLTNEAAVEGGPISARVNAVVPGSVRTPAFERYLGLDGLARYAEQLPLRRIADPADIAAAAVVFLAPPEAANITGVALPVDGGLGAVLSQPRMD